MTCGKRIERVEPGSIAEELDLAPGDSLVAVDGVEPGDILAWQLAESSEELVLTIHHPNGETIEYEIEKDYDEPIGLVFESPTLDKIRTCQNRCLFCFVDQMPQNMRKTLYIKDDDYRLSFLSGSYITLTNISDDDINRIKQLHLSPLYVSVHATEPKLRRRLMRHKRAGELLSIMQRLAEAGIRFHTQVVLCPGLNDGEALERTISDLYALYPAVQTLAVVPVGLTGHRAGLTALTASDQKNAVTVLEQIDRWQQKCLREQGTRFVFASDEFYTTAQASVPPDHDYEGYPQLENGVGLVRLLLNEWKVWQNRLPQRVEVPTRATVATGVSAAVYLAPIIERLNRIDNLEIKLMPVKSCLFGGQVTVAGLLTYHDLTASIKEADGTLYLPSVMLREGKELFLDGYTIEDLAEKVKAEVRVADNLDDFIQALLRTDKR